MLAIPLGLLIGLLLGALGGGGSILTVPALVYVLGQDADVAITSSLIIVGATSLVALVPHARAGHVRVAQGLILGGVGSAGSVAGSALSTQVPSDVLLIGFAGLMVLVAVLMHRHSLGAGAEAGGETALGAPLPPGRQATSRFRVVRVVASATAVGLLTGFFGVGGGFVLVPVLVLALGYAMPVAVGTSLLVIAVNSATALVARVGPGTEQLDWVLIAMFAAAAFVASLLGGRLTSRIGSARLTRTFVVLLVAVALYTAVRSITAMR